MIRQTICFLAVFLVGIISSQDLMFLTAESTEEIIKSEINGNLYIVSVANTNNEITHQPIEHEPLESVKDVDGIIHYTLGARTSGDRLVAHSGQNQSWGSPHNVNTQLTYPSQGIGAAVTYVAIVVNQTSNLGKAYVVKGGIHQHVISIVVEAYNTYVFNVNAYVYGI